jgi:hypothetical protein
MAAIRSISNHKSLYSSTHPAALKVRVELFPITHDGFATFALLRQTACHAL